MATAKKTEETKVEAVVEDVQPEATQPEAPKVPEAPKAEDKVEVYIPRGYANDEPNLTVYVNGRSFILPKGKKSMGPKHIAYEIERSRRAEEAMYERSAALSEAAKSQALM